MIARPPSAAGSPVYRRQGAVQAGAPLTVGDGETAVLARDGAVIRVVPTGSYQVPAEFAGEGVEAWFVSTRPVVGVKFGGQLSLPGVRAIFGDCVVQIVRPDLLVAGLLKMGPGADAGWSRHVSTKLVNASKDVVVRGQTDPATLIPALLDDAASLRDQVGVAVLEITRVQVT